MFHMPMRQESHEPDPSEGNSAAFSNAESLNRAFSDCLRAIDCVGDILSKRAAIGWKAFEEECCQYLVERLAGSPEDAESRFPIAAAVHGKEQFLAGNEHYIHLPDGDSGTRVVKWTYGNAFGLKLKVYPIDPEGMEHHVIPTGNSDPRHYLRRWIILNTIGPAITRFEGLLPPDSDLGERLPRLVVSQDMLPQFNPDFRDVVTAFRDIGFVQIAEHAYYRTADNILLGDATPWNVRILDGRIVPFDAVAEHPDIESAAWCAKKALGRI